MIDRLLAGLIAADRSPADLAAELGLHPQQILAVIASTDLETLCQRWCALNEQRTTMLLSQIRASAAVRLAQFLAGDDSESVRKACVDLLKAGPARPAAARSAAAHHDPGWPAAPASDIEAAVLANLARLGRDELASAGHEPDIGRSAAHDGDQTGT